MLNRADYLVTYDKELGVIYAPKKKTVKTTTPAHAEALEKCLDQYYSDEMSAEDKEALENYMRRSFEDDPDLPVMEYPDLMNTKRIRRFEIMVANECNLNCRYCYANGGDYGETSQRITPTMAITYIDAFLEERYDEVDVVMFFGGEPTLCPDTISAICDFFSKGVESGRFKKLPDYTMVSNGTLIDSRMAEIIVHNKIRVTISVDGPQEVNDLLRMDKGGHGSFVRIEKGIQELKKLNYSPCMLEATFTSIHQNLGYDKQAVRNHLRNKFGIENIMVVDCEGSEGQGFKPTGDTEDEEEIKRNIFSTQTHIHQVLSTYKFVDLNCDAGLASIALFPDGTVYPCHRFVINKNYLIARYVNGQFDFSNYNCVLEKIRHIQRLQNPECQQCEINSLCQRCPASMLLTEGIDRGGKFCQEEILREHKAALNYAKQQFLNQKAVASVQE